MHNLNKTASNIDGKTQTNKKAFKNQHKNIFYDNLHNALFFNYA